MRIEEKRSHALLELEAAKKQQDSARQQAEEQIARARLLAEREAELVLQQDEARKQSDQARVTAAKEVEEMMAAAEKIKAEKERLEAELQLAQQQRQTFLEEHMKELQEAERATTTALAADAQVSAQALENSESALSANKALEIRVQEMEQKFIAEIDRIHQERLINDQAATKVQDKLRQHEQAEQERLAFQVLEDAKWQAVFTAHRRENKVLLGYMIE